MTPKTITMKVKTIPKNNKNKQILTSWFIHLPSFSASYILARSRPDIFQDPYHIKQEQSWWTDIGSHSVSSSFSRQSPYYQTYQQHSNQLDMAGFALHTGKIQPRDFNPEDINSGFSCYPLNERKGEFFFTFLKGGLMKTSTYMCFKLSSGRTIQVKKYDRTLKPGCLC